MVTKAQVVSWFAGRDTTSYLVGGCVRDRLLDRTIFDLDVVLQGDSLGMARSLADELGGKYYPLDTERGAGRAILERAGGRRLVVDISRLRGSLEADLAARDFTVNALASDTRTPTDVIDLHGGLADLSARSLRPVSDASILADPLRALRAVRLAAELGFSLAPETEALIRRDGRGLRLVSEERVRDELTRMLALPDAAAQVATLLDLQVLATVLPELEALRGLEQPSPHTLDALSHTVETLRQAEALIAQIRDLSHSPAGNASNQRPTEGAEQFAQSASDPDGGDLADLLSANAARLQGHFVATVAGSRPRLVTFKLATLLHDSGKAASARVEDDGRIRFIGHPETGAKIAGDALRRLRISRAEIRLAETIVLQHMRPLLLAAQPSVSSRAVYRFFRDTGDAGVDILVLALADDAAAHAGDAMHEGRPRLEGLGARMLASYWDCFADGTSPQALVDGRDLMIELGLEPGPPVGRLLEIVREAQASGEVSTRDEALALARSKLQE